MPKTNLSTLSTITQRLHDPHTSRNTDCTLSQESCITLLLTPERWTPLHRGAAKGAGNAVNGLVPMTSGSWRYYDHELSVEDYFVSHGQEPGVWVGSGAAVLGLSGEVEEGQLAKLFDEGRHPVSEAPLGLPYRHDSKRTVVTGFALSFSPPKSVSLVGAFGCAETAAEVRAAHDSAVRAALSFLEDHAAFSRTGRAGSSRSTLRVSWPPLSPTTPPGPAIPSSTENLVRDQDVTTTPPCGWSCRPGSGWRGISSTATIRTSRTRPEQLHPIPQLIGYPADRHGELVLLGPLVASQRPSQAGLERGDPLGAAPFDVVAALREQLDQPPGHAPGARGAPMGRWRRMPGAGRPQLGRRFGWGRSSNASLTTRAWSAHPVGRSQVIKGRLLPSEV